MLLVWVLYGIDSAFFVSIVVIPSSHNIAASLCCCIVDRFIPVVVIQRYDCKPVLNTVVKNVWLVLVNHELVSESAHSKPPPS